MSAPQPSSRSQRGLDWLNFFIADVETAFGPFVAVWLSSQGWSQGAIGMMISVNSGIALATQVPAGWVVDHVRAKRLVLGISLACIAAGSLLIGLFPRLIPVLIGETLHGVTGGDGPPRDRGCRAWPGRAQGLQQTGRAQSPFRFIGQRGDR